MLSDRAPPFSAASSCSEWTIDPIMDEIACKPENRVGVLTIVAPADPASLDVVTSSTCHESDSLKVDTDSSIANPAVVASPLTPMGSVTKHDGNNAGNGRGYAEGLKDVLTMMKETTKTAQKTAETVQKLKEAKEDDKNALEDRMKRLEKALEDIQGELKAGRDSIKNKKGDAPNLKGSSPELVTQLIQNFMEAIVYADTNAEGSWGQTPKSSNTKHCVYSTMCARKLFLFDAGLSFTELVDLAAKKGLIRKPINSNSLNLRAY